jgi:hypothetical protein
MRNIILTGIPRSGTTLAAALLDAEPDTVCLNEPEWQHPSPILTADGFAQAIAEDFVHVRQKFLNGVPVLDRRGVDGEALTNYFGESGEKAFVMHSLIRDNLSPDFTLAMKHNGPYLAVLPQLISQKCFDIRAVVRHPLPTLRSWRRLQVPISRGEMPGAVPYWREMRLLVEQPMDLLEKQVRMYGVIFDRIMKHKNEISIIRYEDLKGNAAGQLSEQQGNEDEKILEALSEYAPEALAFFS